MFLHLMWRVVLGHYRISINPLDLGASLILTHSAESNKTNAQLLEQLWFASHGPWDCVCVWVRPSSAVNLCPIICRGFVSAWDGTWARVTVPIRHASTPAPQNPCTPRPITPPVTLDKSPSSAQLASNQRRLTPKHGICNNGMGIHTFR